ncbi:MAG: glycoside hydrolase family 10 protein [Verrucomicrobiales bacterium]
MTDSAPATYSRRRWLRASVGSAASALLSPMAQAAPAPGNLPREFRAAWIATVHNLDWPSRPGLPVDEQKAQLVSQLDAAARLHLNAVIFQVRPSGDAVYASSLEPWSPFVSGSMGRSPGYDPLAFVVREAHRRGLEVHAWFNPFRARAAKAHPPVGNHLAVRRPQWVRSFGGGLWFDPGEPGVRDHTIRVITDVARRYQVDGIHIDDYFYPYPPPGAVGIGTSSFPDGATFAKHGRGMNRAAWRRSNVDAFVSGLYRSVKGVRSAAKVGISPFGIWRPGVPPSIKGQLDSFEYLAADSREWFARGWCDYLAPQLYWSIQPADQSFDTLLRWWHQQNRTGRHLWPGMAIDRIGPKRPAGEIVSQIALTRALAPRGRAGGCHWALKALRQNRGRIQDALLTGPYASRAAVPASPWLGAAVPEAPRALCQGGILRINPPADAGWIAVQSWDDREWQLAEILHCDASDSCAPIESRVPDDTRLIALRTLSPNGVESDPVLVAVA